MTYIVDIILVAVFAAVIISSAVKGFFKSLVDLLEQLGVVLCDCDGVVLVSIRTFENGQALVRLCL